MVLDNPFTPNTLPEHDTKVLRTEFTIWTPKLETYAHSQVRTSTPWASKAAFGQKISTQTCDHVVETPEGHHRPNEKHDGLGVHTKDIVNVYYHKLDTIYALIGLTPHPQGQRAPGAVPLVFQLM